MALKAQKRLFVPSLAGIGTRRCPAADLRHLVRCKGDYRGITLLALPGGNRGADRRGMKSLEFCRQHPVGMAKPYCRLVQSGAVVVPVFQVFFDSNPQLPFIGKDDFVKALCLYCPDKVSIREFIIGINGGNFLISIPMDWNII